MFPICKMSQKAREAQKHIKLLDTPPEPAVGADKLHGRTKYPFLALEVGQCFLVPYAGANLRSLRTARSAILFRQFVIIRHDDKRVLEVARIA